ncbi:hypothetical protein GF312_03620 [Candidatus Poribacteria bacterium]|nr:hypothetical protein [Candidatus Poribacteria bacterium]
MENNKTYAGISFRALTLGICLAALECLIAPYNDYVIRNVFLAGGHFPVGPFFVLTILVLFVNAVLKRINPKIALSQRELVAIWCIMAAASGIPSTGMMRHALRPLVAYKYFATPENDWQALFHQHIPEWRVVQDDKAIKLFYEGISPGEPIPWKPWLIPLFAWTIYVFTLYFVVSCLASLLRKQWVDIEKCTFPLVKLPVEMSEDKRSVISPFFKNRALWIGFALPFFMHAVNGLHAFFPAIPHFPVRFWLDPHLIGRPWEALRPFQIVFLWSMIGFSYLLTLEVSFSLWFFFLFFKFQCLMGSLMGFRITKGPGVQWNAYSFSASQEIGACTAFVLYTIWKTRHHIWDMLRSVFGGKKSEGIPEALPPGVTMLGLIGGIPLLAYLNHLMGMSLGFAFIFVFVLLVIYIALTWQVIHGGIPFVNPSYSAHYILFTTMGQSSIDPSTMTSLFMHPAALTRDLREIMMPYVMNGLKASDEVRLKRRHMLFGMMAAMAIGLIVSYISTLWVSYHYRAPYTGGAGDMWWLTSVLTGSDSGIDWTNTGFMMFGGVFMLLLMWVRRLFVWWPIHPIGYTLFSGWGTFKLWFSIFLGWLLKYSLVKYGGLRAYRSARPVFLGMVLGEMTAAGIWAIIGMVTGSSTGYRILLD